MDLEKKLSDLIASLTARNQEVQVQKERGIGGWIVAAVVSFLSLIGIGIAIYYANKRSKELATAMTQLETLRVDTAQKEFEAKKEADAKERARLLAEIEKQKQEVAARQEEVRRAVAVHKDQEAKIRDLKSWEAMNEGPK